MRTNTRLTFTTMQNNTEETIIFSSNQTVHIHTHTHKIIIIKNNNKSCQWLLCLTKVRDIKKKTKNNQYVPKTIDISKNNHFQMSYFKSLYDDISFQSTLLYFMLNQKSKQMLEVSNIENKNMLMRINCGLKQ